MTAPRFPTLSEFRAWLTEQPAGACVGRRAEEGACPLSVCGGDGEAPMRWVCDDGWGENWWGQSHPIPRWAVRFMRDVDAAGLRGMRITREEALAVLADVEREVERG